MKNFILTFACIAFVIIIGGGTYEHLTMVPQWVAAPPVSLSMFQGSYGLNSGPFWIPIHPLTLVLLTAALIIHRKTPRFRSIATVLIIYVFVLIITFIYFVPELMAIINTEYSTSIDSDLQGRAGMWEKLSIARLFVMAALAYLLLSSLTKPTIKEA